MHKSLQLLGGGVHTAGLCRAPVRTGARDPRVQPRLAVPVGGRVAVDDLAVIHLEQTGCCVESAVGFPTVTRDRGVGLVRLGDSTRGQPDCGEWEGFGVS